MAKNNAIDRFLDVDKEVPSKTLLPIEGYEKKPLLSLKDAVASIDISIHNLDRMVWAAERNCKNPSDGLTANESASIHLYTMESSEGQKSFYTLLNEKLRSEKRNELKPWFSYMKLFFTALQKLPPLKTVIWRGVRGNFSQSYQKDCIWWGVSSCTETMEIMEKFVGCSDVRTIFTIECINGKAIKSHSFYKDENEIILMPGTFLRVISKWSPATDLYMIHLREETPRFPFLAPPLDSSSSSSSINTAPLKTSTISKSTQPVGPKFNNSKLEQKIHENKDKSELWLNNLMLTNNDMEIVAYYLLQTNETLTTLYLHENQIGDNGAQFLSAGLQDNATLIELYLHHNQIGDNGAKYLGLELSNNRTLAVLSLSENRIGMLGAQYLAEGLQNNKALTRIDLSDNQIGAQGAQYLSEGLRKNKSLTILDLSKNNIGAQGAQYLGECLQKNMTITTLFLDFNQIGDKGAQYLGEALQQNKTLTKVDLYNNQIGNNGAQYLEKLKRNNRNLNLSW